jgi:AcrR family transcriptional regulator
MAEEKAPTQGSPARWRRRKRARPEEILRAAAQILLEKSAEMIRMADIAERAGITKGTIYLYFANKAAVFRSLNERQQTSAAQAAE